MVSLAKENLLHEKSKVALSILGLLVLVSQLENPMTVWIAPA
jgi:hypothetical protein